MSNNGMTLRSGTVLNPPPPVWAQNLLNMPSDTRMQTFRTMFGGQPRVDLEGHQQPQDLANIVAENIPILTAEATEAYLAVRPFRVTILTAIQDAGFVRDMVNWGQPVTPLGFRYTWRRFLSRVRTAKVLWPSQRPLSWGWTTYDRMFRSAGMFPMRECPQWLQDAGPFIRDIEFNIIWPLRGFIPHTGADRERRLEWDYLARGSHTVRVLPGAVLNSQTVLPLFPAPPVPAGIQGPPTHGVYPFQLINVHGFNGQCQRADDEAARLRQTYLPAVPIPGARGFTGFDLDDLRWIA
ncbi:hypothetical protein diail_4966, partial [Diaporthe ilicicola]